MQGIGRYSQEEISQVICADFQALSDFLAEKRFVMGKQRTTLDATAYGYIGNFMQPRQEGALVDRRLGRSNPCDRY